MFISHFGLEFNKRTEGSWGKLQNLWIFIFLFLLYICFPAMILFFWMGGK